MGSSSGEGMIEGIGDVKEVEGGLGVKGLFRCCYQYLIKIREGIRRNNVMLESLCIQKKKY